MFIDVHCHLDICKDIIKTVEDARKVGVGIIVASGINVETNRKVLDLAFRFKEVRAALGVYPTDALKMNENEINKEINFIRKNDNKIVAIGEVGMDFKEDLENLDIQKEIFEKFIDLAIELNKPIIVHSRKVEKECIEILEKKKIKKVVMHCFSGRFSSVKKIAGNSWFLSIPTNVKYTKQFQNIVQKIDIKNLLCETDSPFLHPEKNGQNTPKNVIESYKKIAELKGLELEEIEETIERNYKRLFE